MVPLLDLGFCCVLVGIGFVLFAPLGFLSFVFGLISDFGLWVILFGFCVALGWHRILLFGLPLGLLTLEKQALGTQTFAIDYYDYYSYFDYGDDDDYYMPRTRHAYTQMPIGSTPFR